MNVTRATDHNRWNELAKRIDRTGEEMAPCTRCARSGRRCVALENDSNAAKCAECTRQRKSCDVKSRNAMPSLSDWSSIDRQRQKLKDEEERAWVLQQEAAARILRLRKLQRQLDAREKDLIRSGLNSMAELEEKEKVEEAERLEREAVVNELLSQTTPALDSAFDPFDPSLDAFAAEWPASGSVGGTPQASSGS